MIDESKDEGVIQVLAERLVSQRLPRAKALKEKVDQGNTLDEFDIEYLEGVFQEAQHIRSLLDRHPEWQSIAVEMIHLYHEITNKAMENEKSANK